MIRYPCQVTWTHSRTHAREYTVIHIQSLIKDLSTVIILHPPLGEGGGKDQPVKRRPPPPPPHPQLGVIWSVFFIHARKHKRTHAHTHVSTQSYTYSL